MLFPFICCAGEFGTPSAVGLGRTHIRQRLGAVQQSVLQEAVRKCRTQSQVDGISAVERDPIARAAQQFAYVIERGQCPSIED